MNDDWRVRITEDAWLRGNARIIVWRPIGEGRVEVLAHEGLVHTISTTESTPDDVGLEVPSDALRAIRDAIDERLGVRYDESLVSELRSTLAKERERVDRILGFVGVPLSHG